jgi:hypothetical protein
MAAIVNITVENDADFYWQFQYVDATLAPIDMTGASLEMMLRLATDSSDFVLVDPGNGMFTLMIRQPVLQKLALGSYDHSNIMTQGGIKTRIWSGTLTNNAGPTR